MLQLLLHLGPSRPYLTVMRLCRSVARSIALLQQVMGSFGEYIVDNLHRHRHELTTHPSVPFPLGLSASLLPYSFLIQATNLNSCPGTCIRPVGLAFGRDGRLYVSSDSSGEVIFACMLSHVTGC